MNTRIISMLVCAPVCALALAAGTVAFAGPAQLILLTEPDPTSILLKDGEPVQINPVTGNITVVPNDPEACSPPPSGPSCEDVQVNLNNTFQLTETSVAAGETVGATWNARGAWECRGFGLPGSGNWNSTLFNLPPQRTSSFWIQTAGVAPGSYQVQIECRNGPVSDIRSRTLQVTAPPANTCVADGRVPPQGWALEPKPKLTANGATIIRNDATTWNQFFELPFPQGNDRVLGLNPSTYAALAFNTGTNGSQGQVAYSEGQWPFNTVYESFQAVVTMSECPGDFGPQPDPACHRFRLAVENFQWSRSTSTFRCTVAQNQDLYLNIGFSMDVVPNSNPNWTCGMNGTSQPCGGRFNPTYSQ